jgi:4-aminobutyrate aminotransferase-like enzyme
MCYNSATVTKNEILLAQKEYLFPAVFHYFDEPLVIDHAKNQFVYDIDGNEYLDFFGGIVTVSVGHCNETVTAKTRAQLEKLQHVSTVFATEPQVALAQKVASISPGGGALKKSFFTNSGTEANEVAILAARLYTGSHEIVALRHSYHGRSALAMSVTAQSSWRITDTLPGGVVHAHNAYCYRCPFGLTYPSCEVRCAQDIKELIQTTTSGRIAGFIAEPIQGVGGFITPPKEYFGIIADVVRQHGGIIISDEVQTGWGRTGTKWFGMEHWDVVPDVITGAKSLANGLPIGITTARPEVADAVKGVTLSTFGGNPVTNVQAKAVIDYIDENQLMVNAAETGGYLKERLLELQEKYAIIGEVRGKGFLLGVELVEDRKTKVPAKAATNAIMMAARDQRILIGKGGTNGNVIRCTPPMNISKSDVDEFIPRLDRAFAQVTAPVLVGAKS